MGIQTAVKSISLDKDVTERYVLRISVQIQCDEYEPNYHAPRIEMVLKTDGDSRRLPMPVASFDFNTKVEKGIAYATYDYFPDKFFWNIEWQDCQLTFDITYNGVTYKQAPFTVEFATQEKKGLLEYGEDTIDIHMPQVVDDELDPEPNALRCILAVILRICNGLLGICLIPWFIIDVLGMMTLQTERVDPNVTGSFANRFVHFLGWRYFSFCRNTRGITGLKEDTYKLAYQLFSAFHPHKKEIMFLSNRRDDMTGNFDFVYQNMEDGNHPKYTFWLHPEQIHDAGLGILFDMARKMARAKVIVVDDYVPYFNIVRVSDKTEVVQLWHACGAFKTFGFSRLGKSGGPTQGSKGHRNYSYAFVSSKNIAKYYAEGFGIAEEKVLPYGVPRTDIFFDEEYKKNMREHLYSTYPQLKGKKVILFAPTFRGNGKNSAFYEKKRFNPNKLMEALPEEYVLLIKHHPFVNMKYKIAEENKDRIFDFSGESEINDLLFITDLMITDYSSVVYEASLLNIPMLFYAYDLENYVASRDFYSDFVHFVPGKIVRTQKALIEAILAGDFNQEKVEKFRDDNFDIRDGKASKRIADFILERARV